MIQKNKCIFSESDFYCNIKVILKTMDWSFATNGYIRSPWITKCLPTYIWSLFICQAAMSIFCTKEWYAVKKISYHCLQNFSTCNDKLGLFSFLNTHELYNLMNNIDLKTNNGHLLFNKNSSIFHSVLYSLYHFES